MRTTREDDNTLVRVKTSILYPDGKEIAGTWHGPFFRRADASRAVTAEKKSLSRMNERNRHNVQEAGQVFEPAVLKVRYQIGTVTWVDEEAQA